MIASNAAASAAGSPDPVGSVVGGLLVGGPLGAIAAAQFLRSSQREKEHAQERQDWVRAHRGLESAIREGNKELLETLVRIDERLRGGR